MGNSSSTPAAPPPFSSTVAPPPPPANPSQPSSLTPPPSADVPPELKIPNVFKEEVSNNPGTFEELHRKCKELFPQTFEGGRFLVSKGLSSHFQVSHTLTMSQVSPQDSGYKFGATYIGTKQYSPSEAYPVLMGDIDPSLNLNAHIIHAFSKKVRTKLQSSVQEGKFMGQGSVDYLGDDFSTTLTLGNIDLLNKTGVIVGHYLQRVTSSVALGAELVYQRGPRVPGGEITVLSLASKITGENWQFTANVCPSAVAAHCCYYHKVNEQLHIGAELESSLMTRESVGKGCYQLEIPGGNAMFRGSIDTNWTVEAVLEKKLMPLPFTLQLSGTANFANIQKSQYRFGIGLVLG